MKKALFYILTSPIRIIATVIATIFIPLVIAWEALFNVATGDCATYVIKEVYINIWK